ncbi:MAG: hypothetical protein IBJ18_14195 [Phycisphaerales bacterium]|nr:hypothetical protein [Phycisphaerales bacterium]
MTNYQIPDSAPSPDDLRSLKPRSRVAFAGFCAQSALANAKNEVSFNRIEFFSDEQIKVIESAINAANNFTDSLILDRKLADDCAGIAKTINSKKHACIAYAASLAAYTAYLASSWHSQRPNNNIQPDADSASCCGSYACRSYLNDSRTKFTQEMIDKLKSLRSADEANKMN